MFQKKSWNSQDDIDRLLSEAVADLRGGGDGGDRPPKGCKKRKKERKEVIFYCFCAVFEASSGDRPPPKRFLSGGKTPSTSPRIHGTSSTTPPLEIWPENSKTPPTTPPRIHGTSSTTPPRNLAGKLHQLPPLEFTEPHRLPPLEIWPENSTNYPPSNSRNLIDYPPPSKSAGTEIRPPEIQFLDPPLVRSRHEFVNFDEIG